MWRQAERAHITDSSGRRGGSVVNSALVPLPIVIPLLAAALAVIFVRFHIVQRAIALSALIGSVGVSIALLVQVEEHDVVKMDAGGWAAPLGITYVVDRLSAIMLVTSSLMLLIVLIYAIGQRGVEDNHLAFDAVYLVLAAGVAASFVTGDMFNLFVAFEMMLAASFVLLTLGGRADQVRGGMTYVVISLVASAMFITALALLYASTGTINMADLAQRIPELSSGVRTGFSLLLILVFGVKAGLFPLFFWLPDSYPTAPGPVTAIFAGLLTKVGVYAIIRTQTLLFPPDSQQGNCAVDHRWADDGGGGPRGACTRRSQAVAVVPHRRSDRLHDLRSRSVYRRRYQRCGVLHRPDDPREDQLVPRGGGLSTGTQVAAASLAWVESSAARRLLRSFLLSQRCRSPGCLRPLDSRASSRSSTPA